jgi:hypothetical protein
MSHYRRTLFAVGLLLAVGVLACTPDFGGEGPSKPTVEVLGPPSGSRVEPGEAVEVQYRAVDAVAVLRVELEVDERIVAVDRSSAAEGTPTLTGMLRWTPTTSGSHTLVLRAYSRDGGVSDAVGLSIIVTSAQPTPAPVPPMPTHTVAAPAPPPPTPTDTLAPGATEPPAPTNTLVPPATEPSAPTATRPPQPTATKKTVECPTITIREPSRAPARGLFGIEFDRQPGKPGGYIWVVEFRQPPSAWSRAEPIPANVMKRGQFWMAELHAPGAEGTWHWRICIVPANHPHAPGECCSTRKVIEHAADGS